jgi:hypothetical protein
MNTVNEGKEKLKRALLEVCAREAENAELAPEEEVYYSPKLIKNMNKLLKNRAKPYWVLINTAAKRAVAACLVIVTIAGALMSCRHVREAVADFFQNVYEAYTEFFFGNELSSDAPGIIGGLHMPAYIPEGYELVDKAELTEECFTMTEWKNGSGELIRWHQFVLNSKTNIDTENADLFVAEDIEIAIIANETVINAFWNTDGYAYQLTATDLSKEEVLNIIESIKY